MFFALAQNKSFCFFINKMWIESSFSKCKNNVLKIVLIEYRTQKGT